MPITTTYLEMFTPPAGPAPVPPAGAEVRHVTPATVPFYRAIYDAVGGQWNWTSRKRLPDTALAEILNHPRVEIHELLVDGNSAGFAEFDGRITGEIELKQFGLRPEFIGRGLGRYFLNQMIATAFAHGIQRFWLHTCTEDHPGALPNYLKAGFVIYKKEIHD